MIEKSDFPVVSALELLTQVGLEAAVLVPTPTGLEKSIMDATSSVRDFLASKDYHHFEQQFQGPEHKIKREAYFVHSTGLEKTYVSLYRPNTKLGDPRIWLGSVTKKYVSAFNLLAVTIINQSLYILNMSDPVLRSSLKNPISPFRKIVDSTKSVPDNVSELLYKLKEISRKGYIQTYRAGDTGVGMTLETLLGIQANSKRAPDFKGIELKAKRRRGKGGENRSTLFSKAPNWKLSPVKNALGLLNKRGYEDASGRRQLYHTLRGDRPNSLGLMLEIDQHMDLLKQVHVVDGARKTEHDVTWEMPILKRDLATKHKETFWVQAACRGKNSLEEFHYTSVNHTRGPLVANLPVLIETGIITLDYALHLQGNRVRDHGYLFKIHPDNMGALFPPPEIYDLSL